MMEIKIGRKYNANNTLKKVYSLPNNQIRLLSITNSLVYIECEQKTFSMRLDLFLHNISNITSETIPRSLSDWKIEHQFENIQKKENIIVPDTDIKPIKEPIVNDPIKEPIKEPIEEPIEKPIEKPIEEPIEKPIEEPIEEPKTDEPVVENTDPNPYEDDYPY